MGNDVIRYLSENSQSVMFYLNALALTVGLFGLFPKCGVKRWWAFVPYVRFFKLAQTADREDAGYVWMFGTFFVNLASLIAGMIPGDGEQWIRVTYAVVLATVATSVGINEIRIYIALCRLFGKKKKWTFLWLLASSVPAILWGFSKDAAPTGTLFTGKAAKTSDHEAETVENGLTVNLKTRDTWDFLQKRTLLRDIHMTLRPGRMVLLLGGSGAGKTTLINAIIGYEKANAHVTLDGRDVYREYEQMKYEIALVPQQDLIRNDDTVQKTLRDAAILRLPEGITKSEINKRVDEVLKIFGLDPIRMSEVEKLSGGQKKRLSIAMEFISDPELFVLDEPDSGLDGVLARDLMERLHRIARDGKIVIVITHSPDRVADLFDDIIVLAKDAEKTGRLVFFGPVEEAKAFFETDRMENIVKIINTPEEGGEGRADELIERFTEVSNGSND